MYDALQSRILEASQNGNWYDHILDGTTPPSGNRQWIIQRRGQGNASNAGFTPAYVSNASWFSESSALYPWLAAGETIDITSSGNDTAAGAGAQEVTIVGLNGNLDYHGERVATTGGATVTAQSYRALADAVVSQAGATLFNENDITLQWTTDPANLGSIPNYENKWQYGVFPVANGYEAFVYIATTRDDGAAVTPGSNHFIGKYDFSADQFDLTAAQVLPDSAGEASFLYGYFPPASVAVWGAFVDGFAAQPFDKTIILLKKI